MRSVTQEVDEGPAKLIKTRLQRTFLPQSEADRPVVIKGQHVKYVMQKVDYSMKKLQEGIDVPLQLRQPRCCRTVSISVGGD